MIKKYSAGGDPLFVKRYRDQSKWWLSVVLLLTLAIEMWFVPRNMQEAGLIFGNLTIIENLGIFLFCVAPIFAADAYRRAGRPYESNFGELKLGVWSLQYTGIKNKKLSANEFIVGEEIPYKDIRRIRFDKYLSIMTFGHESGDKHVMISSEADFEDLVMELEERTPLVVEIYTSHK